MPLKIDLRGNVWHLTGTVAGERVRESTGIPRKHRRLAEKRCSEREEEIWQRKVFGTRATVTFAEALNSYIQTRPPKTKAEAKRLKRLLNHFNTMRLADINQAELDKAYRVLCIPGAVSSTKERNVYSPIVAVLHHAAKRNWCDRPEFERPPKRMPKTSWFTPREALDILTAAGNHHRTLFLFYFCTGARISEALYIDWRDIHLSEAKAVLRDTKNGRDRVAAMPSALVAALSTLADPNSREGSVFLKANGEPYEESGRDHGGQIKTAFHGCLRRAGLATYEEETWIDKRGIERQKKHWSYPYRPHDMRHTFATWFYAITKDPMLLKQEGDWSSLQLVERYAHLMPAEIVDQIALVWGKEHPKIGNISGRKLTQNFYLKKRY